MGLKNLFKSVFGSSGESSASSTAADPIEYNGFTIIAEPISEGGQFRTAGRITKMVDGELRETRFIRADNNGSQTSAVEHSQYKGKQIIDEQGDSIFQREMI